MTSVSTETLQATIMVVDDTPANLRLLNQMLVKQGFRVKMFPAGRLALRAAARTPPDLFLLDIMMPEMDGYEVCRRLKADPALREIPVLFISALADPADKINAFSAGGVDYVTKPFQEEEVFARIATHLRLHRQQIEIAAQKQAVQQNYEQLQDLEKQRDQLVHMIVHDMRSPLMAASGGLELLQEQIPGDDAATLELWQMSKDAVHKLIAMCNGLLDVSRLEAGQMPVQREPCDLALLAAEAVAATKLQADFTALTVHTELEPVRVVADKDLLHRVLVNLLTNAIKHTPKRGTITVRTKVAEDGVRVEVADTGPGIPEEYHKKIFDKFGQVEGRKDGRKHSSGLGLTFCQLAVEAHDGTIGVESEVGKGSTFWFTLPKGGAE